jgi:hypothetical protein
METLFGAAVESSAQSGGVHFSVMVPRILCAAALGFTLAIRPWRWLLKQPLPRIEMIQAQVLLCAAATVITVVIGDSLAKAFGLVGLGSFVRFRSGLKDPRDAAILFLLIGLGMACGHGTLGLAGAGALLFGGLLFLIDLFTKESPPMQRVKLSATAEDLVATEGRLRATLGERNVLVRGAALDFEGRKLELEVEERVAGSLAQALKDPAVLALQGLKWATLPQKPSKEELV